MQPMRFLAIVALCAVLLGLGLVGLVSPTRPSLSGAAQLLQAVLQPGSLRPIACEPDLSLAAEQHKPGIAAFVEVEGSLFQVLVGQDSEGETWSAAFSGEE
jgi:hypothetical protein